MDIKKLTISETQKLLENNEINSKELRKEFVDVIKKENKDLNAYLSIFEEGDGGIPGAIKDNILIKDEIATGGSKILENYKAAYDATVITKLREKNAMFLGKTNLDEFAMGSSTENSAFGVVKNPHDLERVAGGSSGGSAAAVAAGLCVFALGSDTGGSVRLPASFCGVVGLKPTYGRVSRYGIMALGSSLDQVGPITKNAWDAAYILNIIAGKDRFDSTTVDTEVPDYTKNLSQDIKGLKIGIVKEYFAEGLDPKVEKVVREAIKKLEDAGAEVQEVSLPHTEYAIAAYYIIMPSEASANLARYDGIRYGHSNQKGKDILDVYMKSRSEGFGDESRMRIMLGTYSLSSGYFDAYYIKAQKVRALIKKDFDEALEKVDVLVGPTSPTIAFKIGEKSDDPLSMYLSDIYTVGANLSGNPAISIPCGEAYGLPVGLQITGKHFDEETILRVAHNFEQINS